MVNSYLSSYRRYPIAYASRQANPAESKYAPTKHEVAVLVFAVEHFAVFLLGSKVTVITDHQALVSPFLSHLQNQILGCWQGGICIFHASFLGVQTRSLGNSCRCLI